MFCLGAYIKTALCNNFALLNPCSSSSRQETDIDKQNNSFCKSAEGEVLGRPFWCLLIAIITPRWSIKIPTSVRPYERTHSITTDTICMKYEACVLYWTLLKSDKNNERFTWRSELLCVSAGCIVKYLSKRKVFRTNVTEMNENNVLMLYTIIT